MLKLNMDQNFTVDFFLAGAPKCGTTAMSKYLAEHPNICVSAPKEPFFFVVTFQFYKAKHRLTMLNHIINDASKTMTHLATQ